MYCIVDDVINTYVTININPGPGCTPPNSHRISPPSPLHPPTYLHLHTTTEVS